MVEWEFCAISSPIALLHFNYSGSDLDLDSKSNSCKLCADDHDGDDASAADDHDHSDVDGEGKWMDRIDELGVEPASSVLHCPRSIMEFKQTRGQDGFCGRYQGSNASKRAKRLTMSLSPTLPSPYTPSYAYCQPFVLLYKQVHKDVTVT